MFERSELLGGGFGGRVWSGAVHSSGVADDGKRGLSGGQLHLNACLNEVSCCEVGWGGGFGKYRSIIMA